MFDENNPPVPVAVERKVLEKHVEKRLVHLMKKLGGECYKWSSQNVRGVPDRICVFPDGTVYFVELKRDRSGRLSKLQQRFIDRMRQLKMDRVVVLYGMDQVEDWVQAKGWLHAQTG